MRTAFIDTLSCAARSDSEIFLLTGDLGFSVLENFKQEFPARFFNIGVAESNMAGIACGLALSGKKVFIYSIAPFVTLRCLEHIRNDICQHSLDIKIIGAGGGISYGPSGLTHYSLEDISVMRSLPNMTVFCPGDPIETEGAVKYCLSHRTPAYVRLGKGKEPNVHTNKNFRIDKGILLKRGKDATIIVTGNMLQAASEAVEGLRTQGINLRLVSMPCLAPIDTQIIIQSARDTKAVFTIEEHGPVGGLGSIVAEVLAESACPVYFKKICLQGISSRDIGSQAYLRKKFGLDRDGIMLKVKKGLKK